MGTADLFDWLHSKGQLFRKPAAQPPPGGLFEPERLLGVLGKRVPRSRADVDRGRLIYPAGKRARSDADGDPASVWDHPRIEAMQYVMAVPGREFALLSEAARQIE